VRVFDLRLLFEELPGPVFEAFLFVPQLSLVSHVLNYIFARRLFSVLHPNPTYEIKAYLV